MKLRRTSAILIAVIALIILFPREAIVGRVHRAELSLAEAVRRSDIIVIAEPAQPFRTDKQLQLPGKTTDGGPVPPLPYALRRFTVQGVLAGHDAIRRDGSALGLKPGTVIVVRDADFHQNANLHEGYYVQGLSRSYIKEVFPTDVDIDKHAGPVLLLLTYDQQDDVYEFRCVGSFVPAARKDEVLRLLQDQPR